MSNGQAAQSHTQHFWAKSEPRHGYPKRIHLLEHHLADVGACFEALMEQPTIRHRLARCGGGGQDELDEATVARLSVLAALHDIGKVNIGFQTQIWRDEDKPAGIARAGHYNEMTPLMNGKDEDMRLRFFRSLEWWLEAEESWDDAGGETLCGLFVAALSHHGSPLQLQGNNTPKNPKLWKLVGEIDPIEEVQCIGTLVRQWFPKAFDASDACPLPSEPAFQHMFLGLCILADWIGSNQRVV